MVSVKQDQGLTVDAKHRASWKSYVTDTAKRYFSTGGSSSAVAFIERELQDSNLRFHPQTDKVWLKSLAATYRKKQNGSGGGLSQHVDAAFDAAVSGDRGGLTTTKAAIRKALNSAKQPEGQKAREYIFGVLDIIVKNRSNWSGAQTQKAVREYSSAVYDRVLPKLDIKQNGGASYHNIEASGFKRGEYVGYGNGVWRITKYGKHWRAVRRDEHGVIIANTLGELSKRLEKFANEKNPQAKYTVSYANEKASNMSWDFNSLAMAKKQVAKLSKLPDAKRVSVVENFPVRKAVLEREIPKRNHTATDFHAFKENRSKEHFKMFQGKQPSGSVRVLQPDSAPKETSRLGDLVLMKVIKSNGSKQNINFDGEAFLAIDLRKNLWAIGEDARIKNVPLPRKGELKYLGKLKQIDYVTAKKHIGGNKLTRFWHELGEVDKNYPSLYVDADGFPIIHGGGYDVWNVGIVN